MPMSVVHRLEVIQIDEQHAELIAKSRRAVNLGLKRLIKVPRIVEAGAVVGDRQFLDLLDPARILNRDRRIVA